MDDIQLKAGLLQQELFALFCEQLKKDFEVSGCDVDFIQNLPSDFLSLKRVLSEQLNKLGKSSTSKLPELLYRIDLSEQQIKRRTQQAIQENFDDLLAELIIKRILQKVILKKTYKKT